MPLGIEQDNIAPQLIQSSGQALVQGIRQIGQQISGHLTELQTKRDLGAMAQDIQGLNVQSNEFPIQLAQLTARHPLAAQDERAKMILAPLGVAHAQWRAEESDARAFNRAMVLQGMRERAATTRATAAETARGSRPVNVYGVGLVDPLTQETLVPEGTRGGAGNGPKTLAPGAILVDPTGKKIAENPKTESGYQQAQMRRAERRDKIASINKEIDQFDSDITSAVKQYESSYSREIKATDPTEKARHQADKTEVGKIADSLKAEKKKRLEVLRQLREEDTQDAAVPPDEAAAAPVAAAGTDDLGLPPVAPNAAAAPAFKTPDDIRAAVKSGALPRDQAADLLRKNFGFK